MSNSSIRKRLAALAVSLGLILAGPFATLATAQERDSFRVAWSIYVGWMPWGYGEAEGIVRKWADKYDIETEVVQMNDYISRDVEAVVAWNPQLRELRRMNAASVVFDSSEIPGEIMDLLVIEEAL